MSSTLQKVIALFFLLTLHSQAFGAGTPSDEKTAAQDFEIRQQNLMDRYEDYYTRMALQERESLRRERGADEMHMERQKMKAEAEKIRREFKRPKSESDLAAEKAYDEQMKQNKIAQDKARAEYVRQRQLLEKMENGVSRIPDNEELGIMPKDGTL